MVDNAGLGADALDALVEEEKSKEVLEKLFTDAFTAYKAENYSAALELCERRLQQEKEHIPTLCLTGLVLKALEQEKAAGECIKKAETLSEDQTARSLSNMIAHLREEKYPEKAVAVGKWVIDMGVIYPGVYHNLGVSYQSLGQGKEAIACFEHALAIDPESVHSIAALLRAKKITKDDLDKVFTLERAFAQKKGTAYALCRQANALGYAYECLGEYQKSFEYYTLANQFDAQVTPPFDFSHRLNVIKTIKALFPATIVNEFKGIGLEDPTPIFIVGMPRSGTSLTEQILASHPDVQGVGELAEVEAQLVNPLFDSIRARNITPEILQEAGQNYINAVRAHAPDAKYIIDKMPENFHHLGFIKLALPNAKIIHCARGFRANCFSIFKTAFDSHLTYANDQKNIALVHALYRDIMRYWAGIFGDSLYHIYYEKLIENPHVEMQSLLSYCGLEWDENVTRFYENKRAVKTASINQVNQPLYKDALKSYEPFFPYLEEMFTLLSDGMALRAEFEARLQVAKAAA